LPGDRYWPWIQLIDPTSGTSGSRVLDPDSVPRLHPVAAIESRVRGFSHEATQRLWFTSITPATEIDDWRRLRSWCHRKEVVSPAKLGEVSTLQPKVHIERVTSAGLKHDPLKTVVLDTSAQLLEIDYTAINLTSPDQLNFRYRMAGVDPKWTDAGSIRSTIFQDVPWGDSVFGVQARNRGGSWSPSATLRISRAIPWYQRQRLWPLVALLALLAVMWRTREYSSSSRHSERLSRIAGRSLRG
jgi:hypothetical protein